MKMLITAKIGVLVWADILAVYTIWMMMPYLTHVWQINFTHAAAIMNVFCGLVLVMPLLLQFAVDTLIGNYWMLMISSFSYSVGFELLAMSTPTLLGTCVEYKPECITQGQEKLLYISLSLIALGLSGHMTSLGEFLDEQIELSETELSGFEYVLSLLSFIAVVLVPIIGVISMSFISSWTIRLMIPSFCTVLATISFSTCSCSYNKRRPQLCTFRDFFVVSAFSKLKIRLIPILINFGAISSIGGTYFIEQANHMNSNIGSINHPLPILLLSYYSGTYLAKLVCRRRLSSASVRIMISMILAILCCITAAMLEARRSSHGLVDEKIPMSVFWLVPQFIFLGCFEGIVGTTCTYFFENPFPRYPIPFAIMNFMSCVAFGIAGIGHMGGFVLAYIVGLIGEMGGGKSYFECSFDESRLDKYYWVLATMTTINLGAYKFVESWYASKKNRKIEGDESLEIVNG